MMAAVLDAFRGWRSRYTPLPSDDAPASPTLRDRLRTYVRDGRMRAALRATSVLMLTLLLVGLAIIAYSQRQHRLCDTPDRGFRCHTPISRAWGQYSPYFSVPSEIDAAIPRGCEVTFAQVLSRHGARAPTLHRAAFYAELINRIQVAVTDYGAGYEFLRTYRYTLGADQLTPMGQQQMVNSGRKFYHRYRRLARKSVPFVRSAGQDRVVHSAQNFTQGFHAARLADPKASAPHDLPYDMVIMPETPTTNNTLHHSLCPAFENGTFSAVGSTAQAIYGSIFAPPITARLNANLPGANLSDADTIALMDLCPFETVASRNDAATPFCDLFSPPEWRHYDYYQSLGKWYGFGPGNALGPTQGVGFVNELLARLTRSPVRDGTSTNRTLDTDETTFPLDRPLYADFSHDNDIMGILGALRVYDGVGMLSNETRAPPRDLGGYAASWAVPFAARLYVEKLHCRGNEEETVRVLVNDRVVNMTACGGDRLGRCTLGKFVESMAFARGYGRWDLCDE